MRHEYEFYKKWEEGKIEHKPTFKYDLGTDVFDTSKKMRVPSWCDRVFYKKHENCTLLSYKSIQEQRFSDHRPVLAVFDMTARKIDWQKRKIALQGILAALNQKAEVPSNMSIDGTSHVEEEEKKSE